MCPQEWSWQTSEERVINNLFENEGTFSLELAQIINYFGTLGLKVVFGFSH